MIINHFNKAVLPSGYLGVDIFFVISGFVITSSLARHRASGFRDFLLGFYSRRLKRILPALLVMILISSLAISLVDPNPGTALITGIAAAFGFSNVYLVARLTDYFAASAELNIFLHTWSLGIEEQFYFIFPLLAWWSGYGNRSSSGKKRLALILSPLLLISLVIFIVVYPKSQPHAYFLITSRFWELASGCLISLFLQTNRLNGLKTIPNLPLLAGLIGTLFLPIQQAVLATLACIALTCFLILGLKPGDLAHRLLSWRHVVFLGLISYSLYLWHWPVLVLSRWTIGITTQTIPFQILLIGGLSWLSYRFVESPLRHSSWPPSRFATILVSLLASGASGIFITLLAKNWKEHLFLGQRNTIEQDYAHVNPESAPSCNLFDDVSVTKDLLGRCGSKDINDSTIYVVGDSQIEQFMPAIAFFANQHNFAFRGIWGNACAFPALQGVIGHETTTSEKCQTGQKNLESALKAKLKPGDIVFIGSYLTTYFRPGTKVVLGTLDQVRENYINQLIDVAESFVNKGAKVVIYLNGPRFNGLEGAIEGYCFSQWFKTNLDPNCTISAPAFVEPRRRDYAALFDWADGSKRVLWDGVDPQTCDQEKCRATHYKDEAHFRKYYANYLFSQFLRAHPAFIPRAEAHSSASH